MTIVGFDHYKIGCIIGIYPHERIEQQDIFVDLSVRIAPGKRDELSLDYTALAEACKALAQQNQYGLLETFATDALDKVLSFEKVEWARIRVKKPRALADASYAFVEMEKCKTGH